MKLYAHCKTIIFLIIVVFFAVNLRAQEASGTITLQTEKNELVTRAKVYIYSYNGSTVLDSLVTNSQGQATFSGLGLPTAIFPARDGENAIIVYPNPGSAHRIVVSSAHQNKMVPYATVYDLSGKPVAHLKPVFSSSAGTVFFTWKPVGGVPGGLYLFRYGTASARINHQQDAPSISGTRPTSNLETETSNLKHETSNLKPETPNLKQNYTHTFVYTPSPNANVLFNETRRDYELTEGDNSLSETITPTAFMHFYSVEGNVPEASVSISAEGNEVFAGTGSFNTDSTYMDSREKELNLHVESQGYETLDSVLTGNWMGQTINYTLQEEENPTETFNHVITGEAMDGGYVTIWDADADTLLTETNEVAGSYMAEFENTNESQNIDITQSAPNIYQKTWNGTVADTLTQDLTNVIGQYEVTGTGGPDGAWVKIYDAQSGEGIDSAQVAGSEYTVNFDSEILDSVKVKQEKEDYQSLETMVEQVNPGVTTVDLPSLKPDTLSYSFSGSAGTDSTSYVIVDNANVNDTIGSGMALNANDPDYNVDYERLATESKIDSVKYLLSRTGYKDSTITRDVASDGGSYQINLPTLTELAEYVLNDEVWGEITRENYPYEGDYSYTYDAKVKFEGININHKDSTIMNNNFEYVFNNLKIPTDAQGQADTAQYVRTITPTDTTASSMFQAYKDTVELTVDSYEMDPVYVKELEQNVTLTGTIRDIYDDSKTLDSTKVRFKRASDSTLLAEAVTGSDGKYRLPDIECGTEGFFEVGYYDHQASGYLSDVGHTYTIKSEVVRPAEDSVATVNYMLVPTELELPATQNDPNYGNTVTADPDKIDDLIRGSSSSTYLIDSEEGEDRQVRLNYNSMSEEDKQLFRDSVIAVGDSLFYGISKSVPMDDPSRPFKLVNEYIDAGQFSNDYHPAQNYHPDSLGWNVSVGSNETIADAFIPYDNGKQYQEKATLGGDISVDLTDIAGNLKETYGRSEHRNDVTGYPSYMNANASYPTLDDRAINYLHHKNEKERLGEDSKAYYPLDKLEYSISQ